MSTRSVPRAALGLTRARPLAQFEFDLFNIGHSGGLLEREAGLGVVAARIASARSVLLEAAGNLRAPFGLRRLVGGAGSNSYRLRDFLAPAVLGASTSQKEQLSASSSRRAPHFEQMRITGPFCAAEDPVERADDTTMRGAGRPGRFEFV